MRLKLLMVLAILALIVANRPIDLSVFERYIALDYYHLKLGFFFFLGGTLAAWRHILKGHRLLQLLLAGAIATWHFNGPIQQLFLWATVGVLVVWLARDATAVPNWPNRWGDWSYGVYLYGFPVQQLLAHFGVHHYGVTIYLLAATPITIALGAASWYYLEKPAMRWRV